MASSSAPSSAEKPKSPLLSKDVTPEKMNSSPFSKMMTPSPASSLRLASVASNELSPSLSGTTESYAPKDAQHGKEWCIELMTESGRESTLRPDIDFAPELLSDFASLDFDVENFLDPHTSVEVACDMATALEDTIRDCCRTNNAVTVRRWLNGSKKPEQAAMKTQVEQLFDQELALGEEKGKKLGFDGKADLIAERRLTKRLFNGSGPPPAKKVKGEKHTEFQVKLRYLIGGDGGCTRVKILLFKYETPFDEFLRALQEATSLCTIPPEDFPEERSVLSTVPKKNSSALYPSFRDLVPISEIPVVEQSVAAGDVPEASTVTPPKTPVITLIPDISSPANGTPWNRGVTKGYVLKDGPWAYYRRKTSVQTGQQKQDIKRTISGIEDYRWMIRMLKAANFSTPESCKVDAEKAKARKTKGNSTLEDPFEPNKATNNVYEPAGDDHKFKHGIFIMHSLDYALYAKYTMQREKEKKEDEDFRNLFKQEHGEEIGQRWADGWDEEVNRRANPWGGRSI